MQEMQLVPQIREISEIILLLAISGAVVVYPIIFYKKCCSGLWKWARSTYRWMDWMNGIFHKCCEQEIAAWVAAHGGDPIPEPEDPDEFD